MDPFWFEQCTVTMMWHVDLRTALRPRAGLAFDTLGLAVYVAIVFSCIADTLNVQNIQSINSTYPPNMRVYISPEVDLGKKRCIELVYGVTFTSFK